MKIVSFDAGPKQVKDLKDGILQALVAQKPGDIGAQGVAAGDRRPQGRGDQAEDPTGSVILTKDNLSQNQDAIYKSSC